MKNSAKKDKKEYEVEEVIGKRKRDSEIQYKVKWKGYSLHESSWEPLSNMQNSMESIAKYEERLAKYQQQSNAKRRNKTMTSKDEKSSSEDEDDVESENEDKKDGTRSDFHRKKASNKVDESVKLNSNHKKTKKEDRKYDSSCMSSSFLSSTVSSSKRKSRSRSKSARKHKIIKKISSLLNQDDLINFQPRIKEMEKKKKVNHNDCKQATKSKHNKKDKAKNSKVNDETFALKSFMKTDACLSEKKKKKSVKQVSFSDSTNESKEYNEKLKSCKPMVRNLVRNIGDIIMTQFNSLIDENPQNNHTEDQSIFNSKPNK